MKRLAIVYDVKHLHPDRLPRRRDHRPPHRRLAYHRAGH
jgi:hypothetical protein